MTINSDTTHTILHGEYLAALRKKQNFNNDSLFTDHIKIKTFLFSGGGRGV